MSLVDLVLLAIKRADSAPAVRALLREYVSAASEEGPGPVSPSRPPAATPRDAEAAASLPSAKPLVAAVVKLGSLGALQDAVRVVQWAWGVEAARPVRRRSASAMRLGGRTSSPSPRRQGGSGPVIDVHPTVLTALFVELARVGRHAAAQYTGTGDGGGSTPQGGLSGVSTYGALRRANAAASLLAWAIHHAGEPVVSGGGGTPPREWGDWAETSRVTAVRADGYLPAPVYSAALRVWAAHGVPAGALVDAFGYRSGLMPRGAGVAHEKPDRDLTRAARLAAEERQVLARRGVERGDAHAEPTSLAERAFLWQARGGLWLPARGAVIPPRDSLNNVRAGSLTDTALPVDEAAPIAHGDARAVYDGIDTLRRVAQSVAAAKVKSSPAPSTVTLGPRGYSPLVDLPNGSTTALRLAAAVLREATRAYIYRNGVAQPVCPPPADARVNTETIAACFALAGSPADVLGVAQCALHLGVPLTTGPGLAVGVARAVDFGGVAEAHAVLELAQAQDNVFALREDEAKAGSTLRPPLRSVPLVAARAVEAALAQPDAGSPVAALLRRVGVEGRRAGLPPVVVLQLQATTLSTGALPLALPPVTLKPSRGMSEAYCALIRAAVGNGAHVQAAAGWQAARSVGVEFSLPTLRAVLKAFTELQLPVDVHRLAGWLEAQRGFPDVGRDAAQGSSLASSVALHVTPSSEGAPREGDLAGQFQRLGEVYAAATAVSHPPSTSTAADALAAAVSALARVPLPADARAYANARGLKSSDVSAYADVAWWDPARGGEEHVLLHSDLAGVQEVSAAVLVLALDALSGIGEGGAVAQVGLRELGRVVAMQLRTCEVAPALPPVLLSTPVARAIVRGLAVAGELHAALSAARACLSAGARLGEEDLLTLVLSVLHPDDTEPAFGALELMASSGIAPTQATLQALATMTATLARGGRPVPDALVRMASEAGESGTEDGRSARRADAGASLHSTAPVATARGSLSIMHASGGDTTTTSDSGSEARLLLSSLTALADAGLARAVRDGLLADEEAGADGSGSDTHGQAVEVRLDSPLVEAAQTARVLSSSVLQWTYQQMQLVAAQHKDMVVAQAGATQAGATVEEAGVGDVPPSAGDGTGEVQHAECGDLTFLAAAREMLLLAVAEWPVSQAVAAARHHLDMASVRRARVAVVSKRHAVKLSSRRSSRSSRWLSFDAVLATSASWDEYTSAMRRMHAPPSALIAKAQGHDGGRLQTLPDWAWGREAYWRSSDRGLNPDEDGSGLVGAGAVFGRGAARLSADATPALDRATAHVALDFEDARTAAVALVASIHPERAGGSAGAGASSTSTPDTPPPPVIGDMDAAALLRAAGRLSAAWSTPTSARERAHLGLEGGDADAAAVYLLVCASVPSGGRARERAVRHLALHLQRAAVHLTGPLAAAGGAGSTARASVSALQSLKDRLAAAVRAGIRSSAVLDAVLPPKEVTQGGRVSASGSGVTVVELVARARELRGVLRLARPLTAAERLARRRTEATRQRVLVGSK